MNVLFEFSRRRLDERQEALEAIRAEILGRGHQLTNDLLEDTREKGVVFPEDVYEKVTKAIIDAGVIIIEGTWVSLSIGYVLTESIHREKPVLFLRDVRVENIRNRFVESIDSKFLVEETYRSPHESRGKVRSFLEGQKHIKTRFNLVMPHELNSYIATRSDDEGISKTEYILRLIEKDIGRNG